MAKRSDFAQKLLDDLRLRKERMAASSQSSNRSNSMAIIDAYSYAKQNYRGSKDARTNEMVIGSRGGNSRNRSSSSIVGESAKQIVSYGRGQRADHQFGDFSMAIAFALENGAKLGRTDSSTRSSMLGFLQQIGRRRSVSNADRHRPSTSHFPAFSPTQIEEISKGAQKLNQILRACSNGINFDQYSIQIGKELLKGAIDLENSLKMLVNLQEASEYMVGPQKKKNRIKLLDETEEDDECSANIAEEWKLDLPRFSFDKPSRHSIPEFERTVLKQRLPALTNSTERTNFNHESQAVIASRTGSHSRSLSHGSNSKPLSTSSQHRNQPSSSDSKPEKARIPNVIAKLMGIEKLPENESSVSITQKNTSSSKPKDERETFRRATQETTKIVGQKAKGVENLAPPKKQKVVEDNKINHIVQSSASSVSYREKNASAHFDFQVVIDDEKLPNWENSQGTRTVARSEKAMIRKDEQQNVAVQLKHNNGSSRMNNKEIYGRNSLEASSLLQQKRQAEKQYSSSQKKSDNNLEFQQPPILRKPASEDRKHNLHQRKQKGSTEIISRSLSKRVRDGTSLQQKQPQTNQEKLNKKSSKMGTNAIQFEGYPNGRPQNELVVRERSLSESNAVYDSNNWNPDQVLESESGNEKPRVPPIMDEKAVHLPILQKAKATKVHRNDQSPRRIDEVVARRNGSLSNITRPQRHQSSILREVKPRKAEKLSGQDGTGHVRDVKPEEIEPRIIKSNRSAASINQLRDFAQQLHKEEDDNSFNLHSSKEDEYKSLKEPETLAPNATCEDVMPIHQQDQAPFCEDQEIKCGRDVPNELIEPHHGETTDISYEPELKQEKTIKTIDHHQPIIKQEPLTESENHLKQILIKSQLFLNTAEALFKLDIPISVLDASGHDHDHDQDQDQDQEDRKIILDCGYEVMRRTGRKQELALHPCLKISISFVKRVTFDGLVKQLNKDFEKLRFYGRNGRDDLEADHEYLLGMLESDVYNKDPHVNCMWDLGWNESMFAFIEIDEVVKDVEKHLLNGLLDDITGDLFLQMSFS